MDQNLLAVLRPSFMRNATAIEVVDPAVAGAILYSHTDLDAGSARLASFSASLGLEKGARIAVHCDKSPEVLML